MTEKEKLIFKMINEGRSLNEIAKALYLSPKQIHQKIQKLISDGYYISPLYYDTGNIRYVLQKDERENTIDLNLNDSSKFKALIISDIHAGNELENFGYLYKAYDYARDNDIHIILNCGDLIDGTFTRGKQSINSIDKQIDHVLEAYPYDRNILNIICFGNHDHSALENGRDIASALKQRRQDLINGGYGFSLINIGKDQFALSHPLHSIHFKPLTNKFVLEGHHHKMLIKINHNNFIINVPPLSDLCFGGQDNPAMLEMKLFLNAGFIYSGNLKQIGIKKFDVYNETHLDFFLKHEKLDEKKLILK